MCVCVCGCGVEWLGVSRLNDTVLKTLRRSRRDTEEWKKCHDVALARQRPGRHVVLAHTASQCCVRDFI